jgi:hypothetical protein
MKDRAAKDLGAKKDPKGGIIAVLIGLAKPKEPAPAEERG